MGFKSWFEKCCAFSWLSCAQNNAIALLLMLLIFLSLVKQFLCVMSCGGHCEALIVKESDADLDVIVSGNKSQMMANAERQYNRKLVEFTEVCGVPVCLCLF